MRLPKARFQKGKTLRVGHNGTMSATLKGRGIGAYREDTQTIHYQYACRRDRFGRKYMVVNGEKKYYDKHTKLENIIDIPKILLNEFIHHPRAVHAWSGYQLCIFIPNDLIAGYKVDDDSQDEKNNYRDDKSKDKDKDDSNVNKRKMSPYTCSVEHKRVAAEIIKKFIETQFDIDPVKSAIVVKPGQSGGTGVMIFLWMMFNEWHNGKCNVIVVVSDPKTSVAEGLRDKFLSHNINIRVLKVADLAKNRITRALDEAKVDISLPTLIIQDECQQNLGTEGGMDRLLGVFSSTYGSSYADYVWHVMVSATPFPQMVAARLDKMGRTFSTCLQPGAGYYSAQNMLNDRRVKGANIAVFAADFAEKCKKNPRYAMFRVPVAQGKKSRKAAKDQWESLVAAMDSEFGDNGWTEQEFDCANGNISLLENFLKNAPHKPTLCLIKHAAGQSVTVPLKNIGAWWEGTRNSNDATAMQRYIRALGYERTADGSKNEWFSTDFFVYGDEEVYMRLHRFHTQYSKLENCFMNEFKSIENNSEMSLDVLFNNSSTFTDKGSNGRHHKFVLKGVYVNEEWRTKNVDIENGERNADSANSSGNKTYDICSLASKVLQGIHTPSRNAYRHDYAVWNIDGPSKNADFAKSYHNLLKVLKDEHGIESFDTCQIVLRAELISDVQTGSLKSGTVFDVPNDLFENEENVKAA